MFDIRYFFQNQPLITIWYKPRITIRNLIGTEAEKFAIFFAVFSGIAHATRQAVLSLSDIFSFGVFFFGAIQGILSLFLASIAVHLLNRILGGTASRGNIQMVLAWSSITDAILLLSIIAISFIISGISLGGLIEQKGMLLIFSSEVLIYPLTLLLFIWRAFILISGMMEINDFSLGKAIVLSTAGYLVMLIPYSCNFLF